MSDLIIRSNDHEILELAYRIVAGWLNEPLGPINKAIPKMPNLQQTTGLQLKALVEEYGFEIKRFKDVLTGRLKSYVNVVEPSIDSFSMQKAKRLELERQENTETIKKGITILEKRRNAFWKRLQILRLKQPLVQRKMAEAGRIVEKANQLNNRILNEAQRLKQMLSEMEGLKAKYNNTYNEFQKTNLDPDKQFPPFNVEVPRFILQAFG